jgi:hypothetical protein
MAKGVVTAPLEMGKDLVSGDPRRMGQGLAKLEVALALAGARHGFTSPVSQVGKGVALDIKSTATTIIDKSKSLLSKKSSPPVNITPPPTPTLSPNTGLPDLPEGYHYRRVADNLHIARNPGRAVDLEPMHLEGGQLKFGPSPGNLRNTANRAAFLRQMADDPNVPSWMRIFLKRGRTPPGFAVHHRKALFDGGLDTIENMQLKPLDLHNMRHRRYRPGGSHPSLSAPSTGSNY